MSTKYKLVFILLLSAVVCLLHSCIDVVDDVDGSQLRGYDFRLFKKTKAWDLIKAVRSEDTKEIAAAIQQDTSVLNLQEPYYGKTPLMLAIMNHKFKAAEFLLNNGADPNVHDSYDGKSAIILAADIQNEETATLRLLSLLLSKSANPNDDEVGPRREGNTTRQTPLLEASATLKAGDFALKKVKILVEGGADVNHVNDYGDFPLKEALIFDHYDVALFLLESGAKYDLLFFDRSQFGKGGEKVYILDLMREDVYSPDSEAYGQKMKVVAFLKAHGLDYWKKPVPDFIKKKIQEDYPDNWQEYLRKY
ncbi:ankyrin repeat domain-containing protein [Chitinophaga sp. Cy-1792]|uniref:ankyrin repeat domain-containing protein n=1 Tax=Chitinophaga sp. Cy-1792 TaxID=2608339 RepID=UPI00141FEECB|nr:ankyrin repeat domain-containing protein [Chitinophaga sp. Cy-1792]NIG52797.1 ankyrin repeat domain-containing protein [Chitinophaga sp. Cy-1792]